MGNIAAEARNLLDHAGAEEHVLDAGRQEQRFKLRVQLFIGERHLKFIFKVGDCAQTLHNGSRMLFACVIRQKTAPAVYLYIFHIGRDGAQHFHTLLHRKARALIRVYRYRDDDFVENFARTGDDVHVSQRDRVKAARTDPYSH